MLRHALLAAHLAIVPLMAGAAPPPAPASAPVELTSGDYTAGQGGASAAARNRQSTLTVSHFRVSTSLGAQAAPAHRAYLTVGTDWRNTGSIPYLVPQLNNHLFLLIDGDRPATLSEATGAAPHPLMVDDLRVPASGSAAGDVVFEIPDRGVTSLELRFIDSDQGNMNVPLFGRAPPEPRPIAGPAGNGLIEATLLGLREAAAAGGVHAPAGRTYAVIDARLRALSAGNLVRFDPTMFAVLTDADGYTYRMMALEGLEDEFTAAMQLLPLVPARGTLAYLVPASHSALTLAINLPEYTAIVLALPNSGPAASRIGKPLAGFEDPDTLTLNVLGLSRAASVGKNAAAAGKEYLILDLLFASKVDQGIEFQTAEQLFLLDGANQMAVDPDALDALPHGMAEGSVIPPHGQARFQVVYQVPKAAAHLILRYRGFNSDTQKALPVGGAP